MISDEEYYYRFEKRFRQTPKTTKGRFERLVLLTRLGLATERWGDNCFEMGDGGQVLGLLLEEIRTRSPELRDMLIAQGAWGRDWDSRPVPQADQLDLFGGAS